MRNGSPLKRSALLDLLWCSAQWRDITDAKVASRPFGLRYYGLNGLEPQRFPGKHAVGGRKRDVPILFREGPLPAFRPLRRF